MQGVVIRPAAWSEQRWKNGRGVTHEIWRWGGDPFDLRLSVARIDGPQEFSRFPGYLRALIPLDDSALTLDGKPLVKHRVFSFSGDVAMSTAGSGSTRDLNVMSRVARGRAETEIGTTTTHRGNVAVFALEAVTLNELPLGAMDTWIHLGDTEITLTASAPVVFVRF